MTRRYEDLLQEVAVAESSIRVVVLALEDIVDVVDARRKLVRVEEELALRVVVCDVLYCRLADCYCILTSSGSPEVESVVSATRRTKHRDLEPSPTRYVLVGYLRMYWIELVLLLLTPVEDSDVCLVVRARDGEARRTEVDDGYVPLCLILAVSCLECVGYDELWVIGALQLLDVILDVQVCYRSALAICPLVGQ